MPQAGRMSVNGVVGGTFATPDVGFARFPRALLGGTRRGGTGRGGIRPLRPAPGAGRACRQLPNAPMARLFQRVGPTWGRRAENTQIGAARRALLGGRRAQAPDRARIAPTTRRRAARGARGPHPVSWDHPTALPSPLPFPLSPPVVCSLRAEPRETVGTVRPTVAIAPTVVPARCGVRRRQRTSRGNGLHATQQPGRPSAPLLDVLRWRFRDRRRARRSDLETTNRTALVTLASLALASRAARRKREPQHQGEVAGKRGRLDRREAPVTHGARKHMRASRTRLCDPLDGAKVCRRWNAASE